MTVDLDCHVGELTPEEGAAASEQAGEAGISTLLLSSRCDWADLRWPLPDLPAGGCGFTRSGIDVIPCYSWNPASDDPSVEGLLELATNTRFAVCVRPTDRWSDVAFAPWLLGGLPAVLDDLRRPLIADLTEISTPPYAGIHELCRTHPTLPVVLVLPSPGQAAVVRHLARVSPYLLVASSGLDAPELQSLVAGLGPRRIVFGSGWPQRAPRAALQAIDSISLDEAARGLILAENGAALLDGQWDIR